MADDQLELGLCLWCGHAATLLCDGRVLPPEGHSYLRGDGLEATTCSAPVCRDCAEQVSEVRAIVCSRGRGGKGCQTHSDTIDHCPFCQETRPDPLKRDEHELQRTAHVRGYWGPREGDRVWLIDAHNESYRLFHGTPVDRHRAPGTDQPLNAVAAWVRSLRALRKRERRERVKYVVPIFDGDGPGWRHELYPGYKKGRDPCPPELEQQWHLIHAVTAALNLPVVQVTGVEADDLIAAYTEAAVARGAEVVIISRDKDLLQLVRGAEPGPGSVRQLRREKTGLVSMGPRDVVEKFDVSPAQLGDLLALAGDSSDSIPGIPGIGPVTAAKILNARGSLEQAIADWSLIPKKTGERVRDHAEAARLSKVLVTLRADMPLPIELPDLRPWVPSRIALDDFFRGFGFPHWRVAVDAYDRE